MVELVDFVADYLYLDHTADAKFVAFGKSLEELFASCAYAMNDLMFERSQISEKNVKKINLSADNKLTLLYNFLDEILFMLEVDRFVFSRILKIEISEDYSLFVKFIGDDFSKDLELKSNVKAVTHNDFKIEPMTEEESLKYGYKGFKAEVVIDL